MIWNLNFTLYWVCLYINQTATRPTDSPPWNYIFRVLPFIISNEKTWEIIGDNKFKSNFKMNWAPLYRLLWGLICGSDSRLLKSLLKLFQFAPNFLLNVLTLEMTFENLAIMYFEHTGNIKCGFKDLSLYQERIKINLKV